MSGKAYRLQITPHGNGGYRFWIQSPNNRTLAKGTNAYPSRSAAESAGRRLVQQLAASGVEVV